MLQQTRVDTVIPYYERFVERFPNVFALASADEQDVLKEWEGLGYYARARNLKRAAESIVRDHDGLVPRDADALRSLPGVGRYTAGALRSIAFGERAAIVDGNVKRVLSRWTAEPELAEEELWTLAEALVPPGSPDDFNQALMELGATVCTPRAPRCGACPVGRSCAAAESDDPEAFPRAKRRAKPRSVAALGAVVERRGRVLMLQRESTGLLGGLWEVPNVDGDSLPRLLASVEERTGLELRGAEALGSVRHAFTHRTLTLDLLRLEAGPGRLRRSAGVRFCGPEALRALPLSVLMRKALRLAGQGTL
jgi:A/G-specific adenine glycosylase